MGLAWKICAPLGTLSTFFSNPVFQVSTAKNEINLFNNHVLIVAPVTFAPAGAMTPSAEFLSASSLSFLFLFLPSPSNFSPLLSVVSVFRPFCGKRHKMTHKGLGVVKPQHNQSRQKANNKNYVIIALLSESGAILELPCPSVIPSFHHSLLHSFLLSIILFTLIR